MCEVEVCTVWVRLQSAQRSARKCFSEERNVVLSVTAAMDAGQRGLELPDFPVIGSRPKDLTPGASILPYRAAPGYGETGHMTIT